MGWDYLGGWVKEDDIFGEYGVIIVKEGLVIMIDKEGSRVKYNRGDIRDDGRECLHWRMPITSNR
jgi:hypothetical protein